MVACICMVFPFPRAHPVPGSHISKTDEESALNRILQKTAK